MADRLEFKRWMEQIGYRLMYGEPGDLHYALFMQNIYMVSSNKFPFPAAITCTEEGKIVMMFNEDIVGDLPLEAGVELLKHEVLHLIFGHLASFRREALARWNETIVGIACDMAINQHIDCDVMERAGLSPVTHKKFGLPEDKTTEWYCEALSKMVREGKLNIVQTRYIEGYGMGQGAGGEEGDEDGQKAQGGAHGPWEKIVEDEQVPADVIEGKLVEVIQRTKDEAQVQRSGSKARGWDSSDASELIEAVKRKPVMPWHALLRRMESRHRSENKVPSINKTSRRGPTPPYMGRVRKYGLNIWFSIDTSGSMGSAELALVDAELKGIVQRGAKILIIHCDAGIAKIEPYHPRRGLQHFHGRGGTDFSPPLIELFKQPPHTKPAFMVYYTDGYGCASAYEEFVKGEGFGWALTRAKGGTKTPCGVELLWLLPEGSSDAENFVGSTVSFGRAEMIPKRTGRLGKR